MLCSLVPRGAQHRRSGGVHALVGQDAEHLPVALLPASRRQHDQTVHHRRLVLERRGDVLPVQLLPPPHPDVPGRLHLRKKHSARQLLACYCLRLLCSYLFAAAQRGRLLRTTLRKQPLRPAPPACLRLARDVTVELVDHRVNPVVEVLLQEQRERVAERAVGFAYLLSMNDDTTKARNRSLLALCALALRIAKT